MDKLAEVQAKDPGASTYIEYDKETQEVLFIFIQTTDMREMLEKYPEVILMDITYKINKNQMPVSVIEVMDGEGMGEVVAYIFLAYELKETLTAALMYFAHASGKETLLKTDCVVWTKIFQKLGQLRLLCQVPKSTSAVFMLRGT